MNDLRITQIGGPTALIEAEMTSAHAEVRDSFEWIPIGETVTVGP